MAGEWLNKMAKIDKCKIKKKQSLKRKKKKGRGPHKQTRRFMLKCKTYRGGASSARMSY